MRARRYTEQEQYEIIMKCRQSSLSDHHNGALKMILIREHSITGSVVSAKKLANFLHLPEEIPFRLCIRKL